MEVIDLHIHGGFGICFDNISQSALREFSKQAYDKGIRGFCPALTGDTPENLNEKIQIINEVIKSPHPNEARIIGVHLEGIFLSGEKPGIQNPADFLKPTVANFKKIASGVENAVKIVVIAPETGGHELINYLKSKNIKVHFGHTRTKEIKGADAICHLYNAMEPITHKYQTAAVQALLSDSIYTELIADGMHVHPDILKLTFKVRPADKIILISDALSIAGSNLEYVEFCGKKILKTGHDETGILGGSITLLPDIAQGLADNNILPVELVKKMAYDNPARYIGVNLD